MRKKEEEKVEDTANENTTTGYLELVVFKETRKVKKERRLTYKSLLGRDSSE